jgi:hypothetical protein
MQRVTSCIRASDKLLKYADDPGTILAGATICDRLRVEYVRNGQTRSLAVVLGDYQTVSVRFADPPKKTARQ